MRINDWSSDVCSSDLARSIEQLSQRHEAADQAVALAQAQLDNATDRSNRREILILAVEGRERDLRDKRDAHTRLNDEAGQIEDSHQAADDEMAAKTETQETTEDRVNPATTRPRTK